MLTTKHEVIEFKEAQSNPLLVYVAFKGNKQTNFTVQQMRNIDDPFWLWLVFEGDRPVFKNDFYACLAYVKGRLGWTEPLC